MQMEVEGWVHPPMPYNLTDDMIKERMEVEFECNNPHGRVLLRGTIEGFRPSPVIQEAMDRLQKNQECQEDLLHRLSSCTARITPD